MAEFPQPGDKAAVLFSSAGTQRVTFVTVERVLKRDVVLDNGDRFHKPGLRRNPSTWSSEHLLPVDNDRVVRALRVIKRKELQNAMRKIADDLRNSVTSYDQLRTAAQRGIDALIDLKNRMEPEPEA